MTYAGVAVLTLVMDLAGLCLWLYWRERAATRRSRRAAVVLRSVEWVRVLRDGRGCPVCEWGEPHHASACTLAAALRESP